MHHLIIGYGYCGYYLAKELLARQQQVTAVSRHLDESLELEGLVHLNHDITSPLNWSEKDTILYYLIPPIGEGNEDLILRTFLANNFTSPPKKIIYFGSSAVYGDQQGAWISETSTYEVSHARQARRQDAETQCLQYCQQYAIDCLLLRIAGIYGPNRLPIQAAQDKTAVIDPAQAPYINHIYVKDLAELAIKLALRNNTAGIYNLADGEPKPMGSIQQEIARILNIETTSYESREDAWAKASPMKREFMQGSKRLKIERLKATLGQEFKITSLSEAINDCLKGIKR